MMLVENNINVVSRQELDDDALRVFGEDTGKIVEDIKNIQSWIEATPHMKNVRRDPEFLKFFLRGCNYSVASTKDKLDMFFTARWGNLKLINIVLNVFVPLHYIQLCLLPLGPYCRTGSAT